MELERGIGIERVVSLWVRRVLSVDCAVPLLVVLSTKDRDGGGRLVCV